MQAKLLQLEQEGPKFNYKTKGTKSARDKKVLNHFMKSSKLTISRTSCSNDFEAALPLKFSIN